VSAVVLETGSGRIGLFSHWARLGLYFSAP